MMQASQQSTATGVMATCDFNESVIITARARKIAKIAKIANKMAIEGSPGEMRLRDMHVGEAQVDTHAYRHVYTRVYTHVYKRHVLSTCDLA